MGGLLSQARRGHKPVKRGTYRITDVGTRLLTDHPDALAEKDLDEIPGYDSVTSWNRRSGHAFTEGREEATLDESCESALDTLDESEELSPSEQLQEGLARIRADVAHDLLTRLRGSDPSFFEHAVVDVLLAMGYGGAENRGRTIGGTG